MRRIGSSSMTSSDLDFDMAPQKILSFHTNPSLTLSPEVMNERPEVCAKIASCIALWAWVDTQFGTLYVTLVGTEKETAAEGWVKSDSATAKTNLLRGAALAALSRPEIDLLDKINTIAKSCQKDRDKLAHWFWGVCPEIADGLVAVNPKFLIVQRAKNIALINAGSRLTIDDLNIPYGEQYVWTLKCLEAIERRMIKMAGLVNTFISVAYKKDASERAQLLRELSAVADSM